MPRRPNVLLMVADDHRHDAMGCAGDPTVSTPTMDALAARGVRFTHVHHMGGLCGAVCVPARAALMTGASPFRASSSHVVDDTARIGLIPPSLVLLPEAFRRAGYRTHHVGKWHNDRQSFQRAFAGGARIFFGGMSDHDAVPLHDYDPSGLYPDAARYTGQGFSTELFADAAIEFLESRRGDDEPFFLHLCFTSPHDPRTAPPPFGAMYDPAAIPLPSNFLTQHPFDHGDYHVRDEDLAPFPRTPEAVRQHIADYYGMISHQDAHMARVLEALEGSGQAEDTVVVYTGDHGLAVGQHGLMGKQNLYDHSIRVPLLVAGPGLPAGRAVDAIVYTPDLYPTLCALAGMPVPATVETQSLLPLLNGGQPRAAVGCAYKDVARCASDGAWKLIRYYRVPERNVGVDRVQLFHLADDPCETNDLAGEPAHWPHVERLARHLAAWQQAVGDPWAEMPVLP